MQFLYYRPIKLRSGRIFESKLAFRFACKKIAEIEAAFIQIRTVIRFFSLNLL